ncbi:MAG: FKBP-type peptidyl-prolyl cis-trans isomerase [Salinivirgaceae bacterium]|nr:FKBP-type peptidyl-prolyl cis-trans isomerase [Salinivirgaceae bacterium]
MGLDTVLNVGAYFEAMYNVSNGKSLKINEPDSIADFKIQNFINEWTDVIRMLHIDTTGRFKAPVYPKSKIDSISYLLGVSDGRSISESFDKAGFDTLGLKFAFYYQGLRERVMEGDSNCRIDVKEYGSMVRDYFLEVQDKQLMDRYGAVKRAGEEFLAKNKANNEVVTTASGLQYIVLKEGKGAKPKISDRVKVNYVGTLLDGTEFDKSADHGDKPAEFYVGQVIAGWTEALQLMPVGSKWKLFIPQELAYGKRGGGEVIPPFSMLIFEVELVDIVK